MPAYHSTPTHYFWDDLVTVFSCPFIKRDLLEKNPVGIPTTRQLARRDRQRQRLPPVEFIEEYMQEASPQQGLLMQL